MPNQKKALVRIEKKGQEFSMIYEVPGDLTDKQKIQYAKDQHKERAKKRPYNFKYQIVT